uniref:Uncharacterized protein n=1 Tax=Riquetophycus sp. TaxID=1897556 RepID=A0A1C9C875_9FLOR|nr:hypothetical protein Riqu_116 [Riquetophycus sp.]
MQIVNLNGIQPSIVDYNTSFVFKLHHLREIWLFNCIQGCQHELAQKKIKISQISKVIITKLNIENISGLLGLLSSMSLINRNKRLHIYSPRGLQQYIKLCKRYSQTNFKYNLYFHTLKTGLVINHDLYNVYAFTSSIQFDFLIISQEKFGKFKPLKAERFNLVTGPLYGKLKKGNDLLLPDGFIINNDKFTYFNNQGKKVSFIYNKYNQRNTVEIIKQSQVLQHLL